MLHKLLKKYWGIFIIIILSFWAIKPLLMPGFFPMHDDVQVARVFEMGKSLKDGMFPVRWVSDLGYGYGYPIFNFYAPLAYYVGGFLVVFGLDALVATKVTMIMGILLAGISMYFLARKFWGERGGVISGLFYMYATYHAVDIYVRGDVAEFWAYGFIPLVFLGFYEIFINTSLRVSPQTGEAIPISKVRVNSRGLLHQFRLVRNDVIYGIIIGAIGYSGIILSHNLTAFMTTLFLVPYGVLLLIFSKKKLPITYYILLTTILGLLLSAFYWLPVPFEMKYTNVLSQVGGGADFRDHFVCISQFWFSTWGYGGSVPGCVDGMSFMVGKLHILFALFSLVGIILFWKKQRTYAVVLIIAFVGFVLSLFLTTEFSKVIWESFSLMAFFQYPWRFFLFTAFFSSFLAGSVLWILEQFDTKKILSYVVGCTVIIGLIFLQAKFFTPQKFLTVSSDYYTNPKTLLWKTSKISDEYLPKDFRKPVSEESVVIKTFVVHPMFGKVISSQEKTQEKSAWVNIDLPYAFVNNIAYFPAWQYYLDNKPAPIQQINGKLKLQIPNGKHTLTLRFEQTPIEIAGNILSLAGFLCLILAIMVVQKKSHEKKHS